MTEKDFSDMETSKENNPLTGKQVRHLRALGHHLKPVVMVGKDGITPSLLDSVDTCLSDHELIKIKILETCPKDRKAAAVMLAKHTSSYIVQVVGRTVILYRKAETPEIVLP
jgi:RNA-binding protein